MCRASDCTLLRSSITWDYIGHVEPNFQRCDLPSNHVKSTLAGDGIQNYPISGYM
jgi:hypothetical protein